MERSDMSERLRLETLCARDGLENAKQWAGWAAALYLSCLNNPAHYASQAEKKPLFEQSMVELERFAESGVIPDLKSPYKEYQ